MFLIGSAVVEDDVATAFFGCDLQQCKGACCTLPGGRGAPLEDDEVIEIRKAYPYAKEYLSALNVSTIETLGMVEGTSGNYATVCIDRRDCVFVYYEGDVAKCSLERAYVEGKTDWRKPLSCHLFPIRTSSFGQDSLRYEQIAECKSGREYGRKHKIRLYEFLIEPLTRRFGERWVMSFLKHCRTVAGEDDNNTATTM